jgi:hypothetical protein
MRKSCKDRKSQNYKIKTHFVRQSRGPMSFKRSFHCRHSLQVLGSRNRSISNLLRKKWWRLSHNGLLLRMPLGGSQRFKRTSCHSIFLRNIVITKEKYCVLTGREIEVKSKRKQTQENGETHESRASNISKPEVSTVASSPDASFELEAHGETRSSGHFLF